MRRSRSRGRRARGEGRVRRRTLRRRSSPFALRSVSPFPCEDQSPPRSGRRRARLRRRRRAMATPSEWSCDRSYEVCRERDQCWSRSPAPRSNGVSGVNAIPLGRRKDESDVPQEEETKVRVWVAHSDCAKIIGRGGRTMRDVEAKSRTKLKVQREDEMDLVTKERYVDIVGTRSEQRAALELLLGLATFCREDEGEVLKDTRSTEDVNGKNEAPHIIEVLPEDVGRVLGRKGETVKLLEKESGTKIEVDKGSGRLEIYGRREAQERALELILGEVTFAKGEDGTVLKDQARTRAQCEDVDEMPPTKLWVKDREAGRVIGRGGETVREIMEKTGVDIKVQKSEDMRVGSTDREIKIFGQKEQQAQALDLVLAEVSWARGIDGMLKTPPETEETKPRDEKRKKKQQKEQQEEEKEDPSKEENDEVARKTSASSGAWVCSTCGGDHRTKECPHATGLVGMGMQLGMQMGMQAMGMQSLQMGMQMGAVMVPPMVPMMHMGGMPGMIPPPGLGMPPCSSDSSRDSSSCERGTGSANSRASSAANSADGNARPASFRDQPVAGIATAATPSSPVSAAQQEWKRRRARDNDAVGDRSPGSPDAAGRIRHRPHRRAWTGEERTNPKSMPLATVGEQENVADGGARFRGSREHRRHRHRGSLDQQPPPRSMSQSPEAGHGTFAADSVERAQQVGEMKKKKITMSDL